MNDLTQRSSSRKRLGAKFHQSGQKVELPRMSISDDKTELVGRATIGKFEPPFYGFEPVATELIREKLAAQFVPKLTTISAPTGYGKTTFLTQLYRVIAARGRPCIWIALDQEDTELKSVLRLLSHAVALSEGKGGVVEATATSGHADPQDRLIARLAALGTPVLFIDNLHFCTDPAIAGLLDALIFSTGAALRLILSSTGVIPFNQGRAKLELGGEDLGVKDLRFDAAAVRDMLGEAGLPAPDDGVTKAILDKTEGWPMAVRLIQILMTEEPDTGRALREFGGRDADLAGLLRRRLLAGLDGELVAFLHDLSHLRVISADLAAAATGQPRAAEWITHLVAKNTFIWALDRNQVWFRFHRLFQDFLRDEAARHGPTARAHDVLERAAHWCCANGYIEDAANYALAAPAPALMREILDGHAREIVSDRGDFATYIGWVDRAAELQIELGVEAEFWYAWALTFSRRYKKAEQRAENLENRLAAMSHSTPGASELAKRMTLLRLMLMIVNDDMEPARANAVQWLQAEQSRTPIYTMTAALAAATSMTAQQSYNEARRYVQVAQSAIASIGGSHSHAWMATTKAILELELGNPLIAEQILATTITSVTEPMGPNSRMVATLMTIKARALSDLGRSEEASALLLTALGRAASHGFVDSTRQGLEAAVALGGGEEGGPLGFAALDAMAASAPPRLKRMLAAAQIRRLAALGETARMLDIGQQAGIKAELEPNAWQPCERLAISLANIDLLAADGRIKVAQKLAEHIMAEITVLGRRREVVELYLTMAHLHTLANEPTAAVKSVSRALTLAAPRSLVQPFLQRQKTFKDVLQASRLKEFSLTLAEQISFFQIICARTGALIGQSSHAASHQEGETSTLTRREIEILTLLESGPSNEQLADQLAVSLQTVKWHLYNLYAKLGVKNRAASLAKARSLKILT